MHGEGIAYGYGFWSLVVLNAAIFVLFALSFLAPVRRREWRSFGVFTAFVVALFTEMYGFPLTIYILTAILGSRYPALNPFSHASGHLWITFLGGGPWMSVLIHLASNSLILGGLILMALGWRQVHRAKGALVTDGLYARVRHPQYAGLFLITVGMLIQWPTIITAATGPVLMVVYSRLARREEREVEARFGEAYARYRAAVPMFVPRPWRAAASETASATFLPALIALTLITPLLTGGVALASASGGSGPGAGVAQSTDGGRYTDVNAKGLAAMLERKDFVLINVHVPYEGEIEQTDLFIPFDQVGANLGRLPTDRDAKLVVYCRSGRMSAVAARTLVRLGYTDIWNLEGGMIAWTRAGYPLVHPGQ